MAVPTMQAGCPAREEVPLSPGCCGLDSPGRSGLARQSADEPRPQHPAAPISDRAKRAAWDEQRSSALLTNNATKWPSSHNGVLAGTRRAPHRRHREAAIWPNRNVTAERALRPHRWPSEARSTRHRSGRSARNCTLPRSAANRRSAPFRADPPLTARSAQCARLAERASCWGRNLLGSEAEKISRPQKIPPAGCLRAAR